jgi:hypothetical protein
MRRAPVLVLSCGALSAAMGGLCLLVSSQVEGLAWLAVPITALGLALVGMWLREAFRRPDAKRPAGRLPGRWYPYALIGVGVLLWCWVVYWTKFR